MSKITSLLSAISIKPTDIGLPTSTGNIGQIITNVVQFLMGAIGFVSVLFIIYGGIQMITSAGDPGKVKSARNTITYAVVGVVVAIASYAIVAFVATRI